jgi:hypothetical protein
MGYQPEVYAWKSDDGHRGNHLDAELSWEREHSAIGEAWRFTLHQCFQAAGVKAQRGIHHTVGRIARAGRRCSPHDEDAPEVPDETRPRSRPELHLQALLCPRVSKCASSRYSLTSQDATLGCGNIQTRAILLGHPQMLHVTADGRNGGGEAQPQPVGAWRVAGRAALQSSKMVAVLSSGSAARAHRGHGGQMLAAN